MNEEEKIFRTGIEHFNAKEFFEAHEVWEDIWFQEVGEKRIFFQGLIQIAAGYHHMQSGNKRGALSLLQSGFEKVEPYGESYMGIELLKFLTQVKHSIKVIESFDPLELPKFSWSLTPTIELTSSSAETLR